MKELLHRSSVPQVWPAPATRTQQAPVPPSPITDSLSAGDPPGGSSLSTLQGYGLQCLPNARETSRTHFIWQWHGIDKAIQASHLQPAYYRPEQPISLLTSLQSTPVPTCLSTFFCCFLVSGGSGVLSAPSAPASAACGAFALPAWLPPPGCSPLLVVAVGLHSRWLPLKCKYTCYALLPTPSMSVQQTDDRQTSIATYAGTASISTVFWW